MSNYECLYRGELRCSEPKCLGHGYIVEPVGDGTYKAWCGSHQPEKIYDRAELMETCLVAHWDDVKVVTIHELRPDYDRRGDIITVEMKDVANVEMMIRGGIEVLQFLTFISNDRYPIRHLGRDGEDNDSWIFTSYRHERPAKARIHHKYWGDQQIETIRKTTRMMASIHGWELVDETVPLLDRIAQAL